MTGVREFQLYLLAKMSAAELVRNALQGLGATADEMKQTATAIAATHKLEEVVHRADAYEALIGPGRRVRVLSAAETTESFAGSVRRAYQLPLWPNVEFIVNEHPQGWAWGEQFEQPEETRMPEPHLIRPWDWTRAFLAAKAATVTMTDEWTDYYEGRLTFATPAGAKEYEARFDLGLLQRWTLVESDAS